MVDDEALARTATVRVPATPGHVERLADRFAIGRKLGAGGMGVVYEAFDEVRKEHVALKWLPHHGGREIADLKREFRALADVAHPNLVRLHELFCDRDRWFFTMERIDGQSFVDYVRRDDARLRASLRQLCDGVSAIHAAGKLHRDLKPSNVLVAADGRVTILDFGLARDVATGVDESGHTAAGTPAYMAPEQLRDNGACPASDWYAVGGMIYEALAGERPYAGQTTAEVLAAKQQGKPPVRTLTGELAELALALLAHDPAARPTGAALRAKLGDAPALVEAEPEPVFVGRDRELAALAGAFERRESTLVYVSGPSGIGKTALLDRFIASIRDGALVLRGRCYERENVPYKAMDEVVDALASHLARLDPIAAAKLTPRHAGELCRVFPVLGRIATLADEPVAHVDAQELRRRAFEALRELLARLGARRPLCIAIDDLQWGDGDSELLLGELLRQPDPPRMMLVGAYRSGEMHELPDAISLQLAPLAEADSRALARALLADASAADAIASESAGSPFFVRELSRAPELGNRTVSELVAARVAQLSDDARRVLEAIAIAGRPIATTIALEAAGQTGDSTLPVLRGAGLIRTTSAGIETYHDRIRETVAGGLAADVRAQRHLAIAEAFERSGSTDADTLAFHFFAAGDRDRALAHAKRAAVQAMDAAAFEQAAEHYRMALVLAPADSDLRVALGDALANAGRGAEAAEAYLQAAKGAALDRLDLERRAAEQLLSAGHIDRGLALAGEVLTEVGMKMPMTRGQVLRGFVFERARIRWRGLKFRERAVDAIPAATRQRIDVGWTIVRGMAYVDPPRLASVQSRNLAETLDAGEPSRIVRSLAMEAAYIAIAGHGVHKRVGDLLEVARPLANRLTDPTLDGYLGFTRAHIEFFAGRWKRGTALYDDAAKHFGERCQGFAHEIDTCHSYGLLCLFFVGDMTEVARRAALYCHDAEIRGDLYQSTLLRTMITPLARLAEDRPQEARAEATRAMEKWTRQGFVLEHFLELIALDYVDLYESRALDAWKRTTEQWRALEKSLLFEVEVIKIRMTHMRGCIALVLGYAREVRAAINTLVRTRAPWAIALAGLLEAGLAHSTGDTDGAVAHVDAAIARLDGCDMGLYAACARRVRASWRGDKLDDGWLTAHGIANPAAMTAILVPG